MNKDEDHIILRIENIETRSAENNGSKIILSDFDLNLKRGEILGIVGETGSGKTLSILSALGLLNNETSLKVRGSSHFIHKGIEHNLLLTDEKKGAKLLGKKISVVFQNPQTALDPLYKCGDQISRVIRKNGENHEKDIKGDILALFKKLDLDAAERIYKSFPHQLSGGELQRVMIAMALICQPDLLVLDEPTASLDLLIQADIVSLITKIQKEFNLSLIYISHNLNLIANITDRVMHIDKGRILEVQSTEQFFKEPQNKKTKELLTKLKNHFLDKKVADVDKNPLISIKSLSKSFIGTKGNVNALKNIDMEIDRGVRLGIIGESGSGKSTLGKCISGLIHDFTGNIEIVDPKIKIAYIFQSADMALDPEMRVQDIIDEVLRIRMKGTKKKRLNKVFEYLSKVALDPEIITRFPSQLSGGQRQRVNLARALAMETDVLICDEITSGLDLPIQIEIINLLKEISSSKTILFISHDISLVRNFCNKVAVLKDGILIEYDINENIFNSARTEYVRELVSSAPMVNYFLNT